MEIHCLKPQIQDHSNKVPTSRDFKRSKGVLVSSKVCVLHSCHINHIIHAGTIFQLLENCFPNQLLHAKRRESTVFGITHQIPKETLEELHSTKHKQTYNGAKLTMEQKMIHSFPIKTTQATPINQRQSPHNKIINDKNPTPSCSP